MRPTVFTIRTSQVAWCETLSGTTPARNRRPPLIPLLPTTTRSCPSASASFAIASPGSPFRALIGRSRSPRRSAVSRRTISPTASSPTCTSVIPAPSALANSAPTRAARSAVGEPSVAIRTLPYSPAGFARSGLEVRTISRSHGMLCETRSGTPPGRSVRRPPIPTSPTTRRPASPRSASSTIPSAGSARIVFESTATPAASARALAALTILGGSLHAGFVLRTPRRTARGQPTFAPARARPVRRSRRSRTRPCRPRSSRTSPTPQNGLMTIR